MANTVLQAIGVRAAFCGRKVALYSGDGGFIVMISAFVSLVQARLPVKIVVLNDSTQAAHPNRPVGGLQARHAEVPFGTCCGTRHRTISL